MTEQQPNVHLALPSRAENVVLVREVLNALAEQISFGEALDDVKAAVSEACNNVVVHAYPDGEGPLEIDIALRPGELITVVRDFGVGTVNRAEDDEVPGRGIGLAVIEALAGSFELRVRPGEGVEVEMAFPIPGQVEFAAGATVDEQIVWESGIRAFVAPSELAAPVLSRLCGALAARAGFTLDRLSDAQLISDALGARIATVLDGSGVALGVDLLDRAVSLRVGRLRAGGAESLLAGSAIGGVGPLIERLADEVEVSETGGGEVLRLLVRADPGA
jgi:anti-sigma regulatory factor (Ser/Thr protein kinase)